MQLLSGESKQFVIGYSKRYDLSKLASHMDGEGWKLINVFSPWAGLNHGLVGCFNVTILDPSEKKAEECAVKLAGQ